jgi:hypothetical protein
LTQNRQFDKKPRRMKTNTFKNRMTTRIALGAALAVAAFILTPRAHAQAEIELISGGASTTLSGSTPLVFNTSIGGWTLTLNTGTTLSPLGIDLSSLDVSTTGTANSLEVLFSESFSSVAGSYVAAAGGTLTSGLTDTFSSYYGTSLLTTANPLTAPLVETALSFSGTDTGVAPAGTVLTEAALIPGGTAANSETSLSFSLSGTPAVTGTMPDGGTTLALLGCAMAGMTLVRSKVRK